jgi:hypothetical protein
MGTIASVNPGQLIDVATISTIIDELNKSVTDRNSVANISSINGITTKTPNLVIQAKTVSVTNTSSAAGVVSQKVDFDSRFNSNPVVTASPVSVTASTKATDVSVGIDAVDSGSVTLLIDFKNVNTKTVNVNIIAVGSPIVG